MDCERAQVERIMQQMYLKNLYLYPRFHDQVQNALSGGNREPEVIELCQTLTTPMVTVQASILAAMQTCLHELKKYVWRGLGVCM